MAVTKPATTNPNKVNHKTVKPVFATYEAPRATDIPAELEDYFASEGFDLRWVRIINPETEGVDLKNISKRRRQGWEPIYHKELESLQMPGVSDTFESGNDPKTKGYIVVGDLALFKRPMELGEQHREYNESEAWRQIDDIKRTMVGLRKDGISGKYKSSFSRKTTSFGKGGEGAQPEELGVEIED